MKESDHSSGSYTDLRFIFRYSTLCIRARPLAPVRKSKLWFWSNINSSGRTILKMKPWLENHRLLRQELSRTKRWFSGQKRIVPQKKRARTLVAVRFSILSRT